MSKDKNRTLYRQKFFTVEPTMYNSLKIRIVLKKGKDQYTRMWEYLSLERVKAKTFLKDAEKEKKEGIQGKWQRESCAKEFLEQVKSSADTDCTHKMMKY